MSKEQDGLDELASRLYENFPEGSIGRRQALSTVGKVAVGAVAGAVIGGLAGYLAGKAGSGGITITETLTETTTQERTIVTTARVTETTTTTTTLTQTIDPLRKLHEEAYSFLTWEEFQDFISKYPKADSSEAWVEFAKARKPFPLLADALYSANQDPSLSIAFLVQYPPYFSDGRLKESDAVLHILTYPDNYKRFWKLEEDEDKEGLRNWEEIFYGTDVFSTDTDKDELTDWEEVSSESEWKQLADRVNPGYLDPRRFSPVFKKLGGWSSIIEYYGKYFCQIGFNPEPGTYGITHIWEPVNGLLLGRQYIPFLIHDGYLSSGDNESVNVNYVKTSGKDIQFEISQSEGKLDFKNFARVRLFTLEGYIFPIIHVDAKIEFLKDIIDANALYVESGMWPELLPTYSSFALKNMRNQIVKKSFLEKSGHFFKYEDFQPMATGDWIIAYEGPPVSRGMIVDKASFSDGGTQTNITVYGVAYIDSKKEYRSIELHTFLSSVSKFRLRKGTSCSLSYYVVFGTGQDFDWIEELSRSLIDIKS